MALARHQGPLAGFRSDSSWEPSAPPSDSLFSDLNPVPASSRATQQPPSIRNVSDHRSSNQMPSSSAYPSFQHSQSSQPPAGAPMAPSRGVAASIPAVSQGMHQTQQAAWQTYPAAVSATPEESQRPHLQQYPMQPETAAPVVSSEERELQYMQQQQQRSTASRADNIPPEFQLPSGQQLSGNPFDSTSSEAAPSSSRGQDASIAGAQPLTGNQSKLRESNHQPAQQATPSASASQSQPQPAPGAMFPTIDYDWATPSAAETAERQGSSTFHGPPGAPGGPSWPPSDFHAAGPPCNFGPPYGPPGPPMGPPGFNQYGPPPMYYPPPPGPPPIVYVDDPYYHAHNRHVGLAAGGLGGLALGALLF